MESLHYLIMLILIVPEMVLLEQAAEICISLPSRSHGLQIKYLKHQQFENS